MTHQHLRDRVSELIDALNTTTDAADYERLSDELFKARHAVRMACDPVYSQRWCDAEDRFADSLKRR